MNLRTFCFSDYHYAFRETLCLETLPYHIAVFHSNLQILHDALFFIEKCDAKIRFCRIIGLVGIFSKNKIEYRPLPKISLLVHANWWECINTVML